MRRSIPLVLVALAACADGAPTAPLPDGPSFAKAGACPANPTAVVTDEAELRAALAAASPGDVIAVEGTITATDFVEITTPGTTLTCASAGSGLVLAPGAPTFTLLFTSADDVVVTDLVLDARNTTYPLYALRASGQRTERNRILCGVGCGFWVGTPGVVVRDNAVEAEQDGTTGLHFQATTDGDGLVWRMDGGRVEGNTVTTSVPRGHPAFGGIRVRDGSDAVVTNNTIRGPWSNGIGSVNMNDSEFRGNVVEEAWQYGVAINILSSVNVVSSRGNTFVANRIRNIGVAGFLVESACDNVFTGNPSLGSTPTAFILGTNTGNNRVAGTAGTSTDDGAFDCDGDGTNDPNQVSGKVVTSSLFAPTALRAGPPVANPPSAGRGTGLEVLR